MTEVTVERLLEQLSNGQTTIEKKLVQCLRREAVLLADFEPYEKVQSLEQLLRLSRGSDCHYDRTSIGMSYSLWYLPQRIHDAVRALAHLFTEVTADDLNILDLGAGTGATWFAVDLLERARLILGGAPRQIRITAVDASAPMLDSGWRTWERYRKQQQGAKAEVVPHFASWADFVAAGTEPVVVASFLFDASDQSRGSETGRLLAEVLETHRSRHGVVISATNKHHISAIAVESLIEARPSWSAHPLPVVDVFKGGISQLHQMRRDAHSDVHGEFQRLVDLRPPSWGEQRPGVTVLRRQTYESLDVGRNQTTLTLDEVQLGATIPDGRMTAIVGVAGSGKSRVLIERLMQTAAKEIRYPTRPTTQILVTAYNKDLLRQLGDWVEQSWEAIPGLPRPHLLPRQSNGHFKMSFDDRVVVTFMNWDKVPTKIFGVPQSKLRPNSPEVVAEIIAQWVEGSNGQSTVRENWLSVNSFVTPDFLVAELSRVVYNFGLESSEEYQKVTRTGRGRRLPKNSPLRECLWSMMMNERKVAFFIDQRIQMLRQIRTGFLAKQVFDYVFIDEAQDLLPVEFAVVLPQLVLDSRNLVVALDVTQALHIGASFDRPKSIAGLDGQRHLWQVHELCGSYRLPISICEALEPLAKNVLNNRVATRQSSEISAGSNRSLNNSFGEEIAPEDLVSPSSRKSAVIGIRPVILAPRDAADLADQLAAVVRTHKAVLARGVDPIEITYAEASEIDVDNLQKLLNLYEVQTKVGPGSMLKIKGLERPAVLWSTRMEARRSAGSDLSEWTYTILTRTTRLLVIALSAYTPPEIRSLLGTLRRDRLLFWNEAAETRFDEWNSEAAR